MRWWPRRNRRDPVPETLVRRIDEALRAVAVTCDGARQAAASAGSLAWRRDADAAVDRAYQQADQLLREATRLARAHSPRAWLAWRARLSRLDQQRQAHLLAVADRPALLRLGSVRAVDGGMTAPLIGEMAHGASRAPGAPARYGIDLEEVLRRTDALPSVRAQLAARRVSRVRAAARAAAPGPGSAPADLPPAA